MSEGIHDSENWLRLDNLINDMNDIIEEPNAYGVEVPELDIIKLTHDFLKTLMNINTEKTMFDSTMAGIKYENDVWVDKVDGMIITVSKRVLDV